MIEHTISRLDIIGDVDNFRSAFGVYEYLCVWVAFFKILYVFNSNSMVGCAVTRPEDDLFIRESLDIFSEVLIGYEDYFIGVEAFNDFDTVC